MKTIPVIISIIALALSGCAHTGYQHGHVGYNSGYTVQRYYDYGGYDRSYYSPGTSFIYERSYAQPRFDHQRREHEDRHRDWQPAMSQPNHYGGRHGDWNGRQDRGIGREFVPSHRNAEQTPNWAAQPHHQQAMPEQRQRGFGGNHADVEGGRQHHGQQGRRERPHN